MNIDHNTAESSAPLLEFYGDPRKASSQQTEDCLRKQGDSARLAHDRAVWRASVLDVVEEMKLLYSIAFPMIITGLLLYGKSAISMFFMGQIGKDTLAGGSLAIGIANITGISVLSGLAMGMEPISSQACGAKQWPLMGQTLQRTITILALVCVPISILWLYVEPILLLCGQDPTISSIASVYLAYSLPDLFLQSLINPLKIYLRTQNITLPFMLGSAFGLLVHAPVNYILVYQTKLGIHGIAIAVSLTDLTVLAVVLLYVHFSSTCAKSWQGWSMEHCFQEWTQILCLAIPSCVSVCLEWWWYELMILLSGILSSESVATMGILLQATSLVYIFPSSLSQAVSTRVGNTLGAGEPYRARFSSFTALGCSVLTSLLALLFMTMARNTWGHIFTDDNAILSLTAAALPIVGLCELGNCPQTTGCGALRGSARPSLGASVNLFSFYVVGLPVAAMMGFAMHKGLLGLWLGLLAAQIACAAVMIVVLTRTDWETEAERARELTGTDPESGRPK
ncbi:hypothetical protein CDL15_Pgr013465 [Punica granatum]|uniref:Protein DETOXIFICATION n=1 Tax=Punica granatum TaxID=22663 RepID=A0A218W1A5_PUNGR|nr:hypothetical protein CDL15_Pgr013465 [Punica granatum]PKI50136.1 hypothetical protein CRG98_029460 [Punica granatum]